MAYRRSEDSLSQFSNSTKYVSRDQTQVIRFSSKCLYPLSHLRAQCTISFVCPSVYIHSNEQCTGICVHMHVKARTGPEQPRQRLLTPPMLYTPAG